MAKEKIVAIVMARMGSTRFPGKVLADLNGKPLLETVVERLRKSKTIDEIVIATTKTENNENLPVIQLAKKLGVSYSYEGGPTALDEFMKAAKKSGADIVVRVTADCPLVSAEGIDRLTEHLQKTNADYTHNRHKQGVPLGMHAEAVRMKAMDKVYEMAKEKKHKDHITLFILENPSLFRISNFAEAKEIQRPNIILTVDRVEELEKIKKILNELGENADDLTVTKYLDEHPEFTEKEINYHMDYMSLLHGDIEKEIKIGNKAIGKNHPAFIIAEAGVDHKGSVEEAKRLIDEAKRAGADAIKFQIYFAERLVTKEARCYWHLAPADNISIRQIDTFGNLDKLPRDIYKKIVEYGNEKGLIVFSTPFDEDAVDVIKESGQAAIKIASGDVTCHPLLKKAAESGLPIIMSAGASELKEIDDALNVIKENGNPPVILLHCILDYPTKEEDANLAMIKYYSKRYNITSGFSDHTLTVPAGVAAVINGAAVIEKHITGEKFDGKEGKPVNPDASFMNIDEFAEYARAIRDYESGKLNFPEEKLKILCGSENAKRPLKSEEAAHMQARRSLVAKYNIPKGKEIRIGDLTWKRPGTGIAPTFENINKVTGKKAAQDIIQDSIISYGMLED